jgi:hypothetical protein
MTAPAKLLALFTGLVLVATPAWADQPAKPKPARGKRGPRGPRGFPGPQGLPGQDGRDGSEGRDGQDGRDGADGKDGPEGPAGPAGPAADAANLVLVAVNTPDGNGWHVTTKHVGDPASYQLIVRALCRQANTITTVTAQSDTNATVKNVTATCPTGADVIGGGYTVDD